MTQSKLNAVHNAVQYVEAPAYNAAALLAQIVNLTDYDAERCT